MDCVPCQALVHTIGAAEYKWHEHGLTWAVATCTKNCRACPGKRDGTANEQLPLENRKTSFCEFVTALAFAYLPAPVFLHCVQKSLSLNLTVRVC